ncbi:MAG: MFS transporter [Coriobacteriia bacterium]|nr:MFS transporter [Coriobacteriia bacterium]
MSLEKHGHDEISVGVPDAVETAELAAAGGYRRLLTNRNFRNLWVAQTISGVGDWLVVGLLIPLVTQLSNGSSMAVAGIMIAKIIPSLVLGSVLGVVVDRFDRRKLMIVADVVNAVLCLGLLWVYSVPTVAALVIVYAVTFLMEICNLLMVPAKNALIPALVDDRDLAAANGLSYTTQQASMLVGLLASGAIVSAFVAVVRGLVAVDVPYFSAALQNAPYFTYLTGPLAGVALDSMTFLLSAGLIFLIRAKSVGLVSTGGRFDIRLFGAEVLESFTVLKEHKELRGLLVSIGFAILGGGAIVSVGLVYVQQNLVGGVPFLELVPPLQRAASQAPQTFMMAFLALGMFLGAVIVPRIAVKVTLEQLFVAGVALFGFSMLGFSTTGIYWVAAIFATASGFCVAQVTVAGNTYIAETVADEVRGRVFTALESVLRIALLASMVVVAPLGDLVSGQVQSFVQSTAGDPAKLVLTGSRITLILASTIVLAAAVYAAYAIPWRRGGANRAEGPADA